ncbi:unnamed protein product [Darwinula stevensoni]|uniref:CARD domain-containing protein n=1 Tax=Darwinula stevensoni TaxID=69355 RepID=A0A7R9AGA2_9CRUS|nr:unnamed protein product [Darwinula stevensoni]CAG0903635.1 unnamed protein product [Darwinula stevensoni]
MWRTRSWHSPKRNSTNLFHDSSMREKKLNACVATILARYSEELQFIEIDGVLRDLYAGGIVTHEEHIDVAKENLKEKFLFLQKCLPRRDGAFSTFVEILRKRNHVHLANIIEGELEKTLKGDEDSTVTPDSHLSSATTDNEKRSDMLNANAVLLRPPCKRTWQQVDGFWDVQKPNAVRREPLL